ncbi:hypothetical protein GGR56DRAFT_638498 [Xylariaceae sp. FL0804]|nr:hypothetical protein GGR56DRAFT_638498 [Xylariaceae sp. FL0804]
MLLLLGDAQSLVHENHIPPSSVTLAWDHDSRSAIEFDPTLKYSSPLSSEEHKNDAQKSPSSALLREGDPGREDCLDDDVDWDVVFADIETHPKDPSLVESYHQTHRPQKIAQASGPVPTTLAEPPSSRSGPLQPFRRTPFPEMVRDRSSVPGLSSTRILRTCFRIGVMISQTARCLNHQQDVVFELFARVSYSSRESLARKQHFQFVDLFKDQQPYPSAVLAGWKVGSQLDHHSSVFLQTESGPRLCWCICKPVKDSKAAMGWTYTVLSIKETDWDQIGWATSVIGVSTQGEAEAPATAKL